jgi:hypothetical protein
MHFALPECSSATDRRDTHHEDLTSSQLEQRLVEIDEQLGGLARYSTRGGVGAIDYRSQTYDDRRNTEWVRIDLERECLIDEVVLYGYSVPLCSPGRFRTLCTWCGTLEGRGTRTRKQ